MDNFEIKTNFKLTGDQPKVINELSKGINKNFKYQTLKGCTGSGKTFCMANIIQKVNKPTLILSHNKTLCAQLYSEFKELFPNNHVEYFVSHYKYFQPEAYLPTYDKYIEKETLINEDIERMRQHCIASLLTRKDCVVVASVSAIFGLGDPQKFYKNRLIISKGQIIDLNDLLLNLVKRQYTRITNDITPSTFKVLGDTILIKLSIDEDTYYRIEMFGDEIEKIIKLDAYTSKIIEEINELIIFSVSTYCVEENKIHSVCQNIEKELQEVYCNFLKNGEELFANRIKERTMLDIEMIKETGGCKSLEVYQRYLAEDPLNPVPNCLLDFFPKDYLMFIDESHATIPQIKSITNQNKSIKSNLINYGFRLPPR